MMKILVIDDEKPTLTMFRLFLQAYGYEVLVAADGKTGMEIVGEQRPQIVFTDLKMPEMDGFEVIKQVKRIAPDTEVIVITGHGDMDLAIRALNLNATDFINKPVRRSALDEALKRAEERILRPDSRRGRIRWELEGEIAFLVLRGTLDGEQQGALQEAHEAILRHRPRGVVVDFDVWTTVSGTGISMFVNLLSEFRKQGQTTAICGISENLRTVFDMLGVTHSVSVFPTREDAVRSMDLHSDTVP